MVVLVAEDNFLAALEMTDTLAEMGCDVLGPAATAEQALAMIEDASQLDFAVLDVNLRGGTCVPIVAKLRASDTPFVLVSGYSQPDLADVLAGMPAPPCLGKPFAASELRAAIEALQLP